MPPNGSLITQTRPIIKAGAMDKQYGKWADNNETITSPKFTANQISLAPNGKKNVGMVRDGKYGGNQRNAKYGGS